MKFKTIIGLSIIILVFCLHPVISAELDVNGSDANLSVDDAISSSELNAFGMSRPKLHIDCDDSFNVGDQLSFRITYDDAFDKPVKIYIDNEYSTTVTGYIGHFIFKIGNSKLGPGKHTISVRYDGDDQWHYDSYTKEFFIN